MLGIVPLGLYMVVHLTTNASLLNGPETFQRAVYLIHSPGKLLPLIEWALIFAPLVFHAVLGVWIAKTGKSTAASIDLPATNATPGSVGRDSSRWFTCFFTFCTCTAGSMPRSGWMRFEAMGFAAFRPYNAASTLVEAMQGWIWPAFYLIGMLACVYHLANGLWTAGITWGLWISPAAQQRATKLCVAIGIGACGCRVPALGGPRFRHEQTTWRRCGQSKIACIGAASTAGHGGGDARETMRTRIDGSRGDGSRSDLRIGRLAVSVA